jgi:DNA-binding transcriptional MocR family regulator
MAFDQLVSLQHRMTQLYALTRQPLKWALHLANAAPQWYPTEALNRITQRLLRRQPELLAHYPTGTGLPALKTSWCVTWRVLG